MRIWLNRDYCDSTLSACESCFGQMVRTGIPDRACVLMAKEDSSDDLTIYMHSGTHNEMLVIPPAMREMVAYDGWSRYVHFSPRITKSGATHPAPMPIRP